VLAARTTVSHTRLVIVRALGAAAVLAVSASAQADVSSWMFFGSGPSALDFGRDTLEWQPTLLVETGLGSPPSGSVIVGGLGRMHIHFGQGADLALLVRTASHGFVNGDWGAAVDLGGYQRWWGVGSSGGLGSLVLGAPWGITLNLTAGVGTNDARTYAAVLGLDFARLTIYRRSGETWWKNSLPAYRPEER
jgi:hypothetical protein